MMNERIKQLLKQSTKEVNPDDREWVFSKVDQAKFAELIVRECAQVCLAQRDPSNLNYKPSERFAEALKQHFGVE